MAKQLVLNEGVTHLLSSDDGNPHDLLLTLCHIGLDLCTILQQNNDCEYPKKWFSALTVYSAGLSVMYWELG